MKIPEEQIIFPAGNIFQRNRYFEKQFTECVYIKYVFYYITRLIHYKLYNVSPGTILSMISQQHWYAAHYTDIFSFIKISRWENPAIDVYSIPGFCKPARNPPGINFSGYRPLGAPDVTSQLINTSR